ncbi:MAG: nucleotidyltransferase family protein [Candidatus Paceibacterota bacterium]|jgi:NDP-sugar pyrophosphorylase family protein
MQAVILAAGKGKRMGNLTLDTPKPLLKYKDKSLLHWKIDNLPDIIDEVILVVGYLGENIKKIFGDIYQNKKIYYVQDQEIRGTGKALWQARDLLKGNFLVMMGDDLYSKEAFLNASAETWSLTVKKVPRENNSSRIELDEHGKLKNFITAEKYREKYNDEGYAFTGLYTLNQDVFKYPLVKMKKKEEWGLPQTLLQAIPKIDIKILETDFWKQITTPEDLK